MLHHLVEVDAVRARDQHDADRILVVRFVADVLDHRQLLRAHLVRDLFDDLRRRHLVGQGGHDHVAVFAAPDRTAAHRTVAGRVHRGDLGRRRDDFGCGREVRALHVLAELGDARGRFVEQPDAGTRDLAQVVRRDVGRHADRDAGGAVEQHVRHARGQPRRLLQRAVEVRHPVDRALAELGQQQLRHRRQARFGIAHRRERLGIFLRAEVALAIDERIAVRERLRHQHHRLVARAVAVRMELADHVADGARGLLRLGRRIEAELAHRVHDAPLHRLEAVADERQCAIEHDVHRVVEVRTLRVVLERNLFVAGLQAHCVVRNRGASNPAQPPIVPQRVRAR